MTPLVTVVAGDEASRHAALDLAQHLHLPCSEPSPAQGLILLVSPEGLALRDAAAPREQPLRVDFLEGAMGYRRRQGVSRNELLARAVGIKSGYKPRVLDATAGLGRDAFLLASLGCEVTLLERNPIVHALLSDGLQRAGHTPDASAVIQRMHLLAVDAHVLSEEEGMRDQFDVLLLDPMFPERIKSALVKKPMRLFHALVGQDADADVLLEKVLPLALKRVVVKRPLHAPCLANKTADVIFKGKAIRFDVYLRHG
ncbi:MAG: class I SAM-dependent methyltransferase [Pseudomonadota bacterium]